MEEKVEKNSPARKRAANEVTVSTLSQIETREEMRITTDIEELDRVLGGGIVKGSLVLVGGDPGIGKSTLLLQVCKNLSRQRKRVLYISGEESLQQIKIRAERIGNFRKACLCSARQIWIRSMRS